MIYNLKRRNARKGLKPNPEYAKASHTVEVYLPQSEPPAKLTKIEELRQLISQPIPVEPEKPTIFRDDNGKVITENQWNKIRTLKQKAKDGGYHLDEYIQ